MQCKQQVIRHKMRVMPMDKRTSAPAIRTTPRNRRQSGVGTGTISLIVVFTVLCFATLALLSLSTATSSMRIQQRGLQLNQSIAAAKGRAAQAVSELDAQLSELEALHDDDSNYISAAHSAAETLGWLQGDDALFTQSFTVNDEILLVCSIRIEALDSVVRYSVVQQSTVPAGGWQQAIGGELWIP